MTEAHTYGREAEARAAEFLERNGFRVLERNYRCRAGEIDLVAMDGQTLVFVEVKARHSSTYGSAAEAIDQRKTVRLRKAAAAYLARRGVTGASDFLACRFDAILFNPEIEHLRDIL